MTYSDDVVAQTRLEAVLAHYSVEKMINPGHYRIRLQDEHVDLYAKGFERLGAHPTSSFMVGFSGAIANRSTTVPPYFSGLRLSEALNVPLISFSDPTMARNDNITLGFHAGNDLVQNLPEAMASVIKDIASEFSCRAIMFGGSGGGFAALNTLQHCGEQDVAVVWNPQTAIARYVWPTYRAYARAAFPDIAARYALDDQTCIPALDAAIRKVGCATALDASVSRGRVFYFQNYSDSHHVKMHMAPFFCGSALQRVAQNGFFLPDRQIHLCIGNWGRGHVLLPRDLLIHAFKGILAGQSALLLQKKLMAMMAPDRLAPVLGAVNAIDVQNVKLTCSSVEGALEIKVSLQDVPVGGIDYAFYLMSGAERVATRWYKAEANWEIPAPSQAGLRVHVYVRDAFGRKKSFNLPLPTL